MSSLTDALANIVIPQAESVVIQSYMEAPAIYEQVADVRPLTGDLLYGGRETILESSGELLEREDFESVQADQPGVVGIAAAKTRQFERSIQIAEREAEAIIGAGVLPEYLSDMVAGYSKAARRAKNSLFTSHYERGVIAAGDKSVFRRSYRGFEATNEGLIYDGVSWFNASHPIRGGTTISNIDTSAALSASTFEAAVTKYRQTMAVDNRGQRIMLVPDFIMVPAALADLATKIVRSPQMQGTPNNDINPNFGMYEVIVNPYLTTTSGWWLGARRMGIKFYDEGAPNVRLDWIPGNRSWNLSVETRFNIRPTDWRHALAQNLASS